jgi:hypothetical protein
MKMIRINRISFVLAFFILLSAFPLFAQKKVSELTLVYDATITTGTGKPGIGSVFDGATTTVYIKGGLSRSEMVSALASFTTIHDSRTGTAVILQEVSGTKLLIRMNAENWKDKNKRYEGVNFTNTTEKKMVAGYNCTKAIATMTDGATFTVYYTNEIVPENQDYSYQFKGLNGLPLEYELTQKDLKIKYTVSKISLNPVPVSKFDIPKSGYREMTYEESRKLGYGG